MARIFLRVLVRYVRAGKQCLAFPQLPLESRNYSVPVPYAKRTSKVATVA